MKEKALLVIFLVSSQYQKLDVLKAVIRALNESVILDEHKRQFVFDVRCSSE